MSYLAIPSPNHVMFHQDDDHRIWRTSKTRQATVRTNAISLAASTGSHDAWSMSHTSSRDCPKDVPVGAAYDVRTRHAGPKLMPPRKAAIGVTAFVDWNTQMHDARTSSLDDPLERAPKTLDKTTRTIGRALALCG